MPDISYFGIFFDVLIRGGVILPYLVISAYRVLAASLTPCLCRKVLYCIFCLFLMLGYSLVSPFAMEHRTGLTAFCLLLLAPGIAIGLVGMLCK